MYECAYLWGTWVGSGTHKYTGACAYQFKTRPVHACKLSITYNTCTLQIKQSPQECVHIADQTVTAGMCAHCRSNSHHGNMCKLQIKQSPRECVHIADQAVTTGMCAHCRSNSHYGNVCTLQIKQSPQECVHIADQTVDRKSTRLNSSH